MLELVERRVHYFVIRRREPVATRRAGLGCHGRENQLEHSLIVGVLLTRNAHVGVHACVEISRASGALGDDAAVPAPSGGEEPSPSRYRAGAASMAWRVTKSREILISTQVHTQQRGTRKGQAVQRALELRVEPELQVHDRDAFQLVQLPKVGHRRPRLGHDALQHVDGQRGDVLVRYNFLAAPQDDLGDGPVLGDVYASNGFSTSTSPPAARTCSAIGAQTRSGWLPSRNAVCEPSASLMKRFAAVNMTVIDMRSGSVKSCVDETSMARFLSCHDAEWWQTSRHQAWPWR